MGNPKSLEVGRLLSSNALGFSFSTTADRIELSIGGLVTAEVLPDYQVYGIVTDIRSEPTALAKALAQISGAGQIPNIGNSVQTLPNIEVSVATIGYYERGKIYRAMMPPRPPISLNRIVMVVGTDFEEFTDDGSYLLPLISHQREIDTASLLTACLYQGNRERQDSDWLVKTVRMLAVQLRGNYDILYRLLSSITDLIPNDVQLEETTSEEA